MELWQQNLLREIETRAYSWKADPLDVAPARRLLDAIGDAVHHLAGHTEQEWQDHLRTCTRPCSSYWGGRGADRNG